MMAPIVYQGVGVQWRRGRKGLVKGIYCAEKKRKYTEAPMRNGAHCVDSIQKTGRGGRGRGVRDDDHAAKLPCHQQPPGRSADGEDESDGDDRASRDPTNPILVTNENET